MKTVKINNQLNLVKDFTRIEVKVICPKVNIQKMLEETKGRFVSKKEIKLNYNHNAGLVYEVMIIAMFKDVEKFLMNDSIYAADNYEAYNEMIKINGYHNGNCLLNEINSLYAFGSVNKVIDSEAGYTRYYRKDGYSILRVDSEFTEFGKKRYIKTKQGWRSNRAY